MVTTAINKVSQSKGIALALTSVALISTAQLAMKWGMANLRQLWPQIEALLSPLQFMPLFDLAIASALAVGAGLVCYALSMVCWIMALKHLPLSKAYPLLSLSYVIVYLAAVSFPWLGETVSATKLAGIGCILVGLYLAIPSKSAD
ncbi:4-amino-4-deoxy-L-arabinose-phospho-UDP flippase [Shewanella maritima]|uniref:Probable 4-amino-4-deoxy-L-arabinose-phosphoundecaprenol flippase subunit ArnF n=1 Tax=Shewanella maritima TaxID=2520507 RepID=A0A411PHL2_9GAMM|nr:4-amino-4-deoxy-L-arabinose-phosphoundecaprenol flippase subunit ArnF [Shewanella maritima]QBF83087.1 4-amino-4-deoxy-L-arabinose-phospho-UDP flippase [Shewanella maritima]